MSKAHVFCMPLDICMSWTAPNLLGFLLAA